ncbi:ROK family transcriptional regulator [Streptomyces sp. NPDC059861]|uniref:ROK family transcriptional regulator n=1 Tax=Streptomyces sp. NPDC059861 TaxID=3346974 RepID=UPI0036638F98
MPASPSTARAINDRLALRLLQQEGPLTAGQLKQLTGLSRPTVADLVERLTAAGLIEMVGEAGELRRGPNAKLYGIVADRAYLAALDVRTEGVSVTVSDLLGRVLAEASVPIGDDTGTGPAVEQAVALVERAAKEAGAVGAPPREGVRAWGRLHTVGIGAPGLIDPATGELRDSSGLPAWHRRLVEALQERLPGARVIVENETNLAALAEQREGAARDRDTFVLLWLGQGTGAAVVLDGSLRRGASGGTGEIGFLPVPGTGGVPTATDCAGGFHSLASAGAIVALAQECGVRVTADGRGLGAAEVVRRAVWVADGAAAARAAGAAGAAGAVDAGAAAGHGDAGAAFDVSGTRVEVSGVRVEVSATPAEAYGPPAGVSAASAEAYGTRADLSGARPEGSGAGGPPAGVSAAPADASVDAAARFLDVLAERLALGAASVAAVLDPGCVVLGGEVGQAGGEVLAGLVGERVRRMSPLVTEVRASVLGGGAVLRGALLTARDRAQDELFAPPGR